MSKSARGDATSLLVIELESETSVPKVFYQGEEITGKVRVSFDWKTRTDVLGGTSYNIEFLDSADGVPARKGYRLDRGDYA